MKVAFLTTIFPMDEQYLYDFFDSLKTQTHKEFDVIVVNDGYKNLEEIKNLYSPTLTIIELNYSNTPAKNREYGINYCIDNDYDILIFGDSDDFFEANRIEKSLELLEQYDIVVNDLSFFDKHSIYETKYFSNRLKNLTPIEFEFIKTKNIFGLSNTAIKLNRIDKVCFPKELIAVDWYLFSILLIEGKTAIFTNETITYYRQYSENIVGFKELDKKSFEKGIEVKRRHYNSLSHKVEDFSKELDRLSDVKHNDKSGEIKIFFWWELI